MKLRRKTAKNAHAHLKQRLAIDGVAGEYNAFSYGAGYLAAIQDKLTDEEFDFIWDEMCEWSGLPINF